jgi:DNA-binding response OmpR family regulator
LKNLIDDSALDYLGVAEIPIGQLTENNKSLIKKILIIEDQPDIRQLIKIALDFDHYEIHEASDVQAGLKTIYAIKPDLVVLDIMLPSRLEVTRPEIRDGLDLCRSLKNDINFRNLPVILLTAKGQVSDRELGLAAGADEYLIKPFSIIQLIEVVRNFIS